MASLNLSSIYLRQSDNKTSKSELCFENFDSQNGIVPCRKRFPKSWGRAKEGHLGSCQTSKDCFCKNS